MKIYDKEHFISIEKRQLLSDNIKPFREKLNIPKSQFATLCGISTRTLDNIESGRSVMKHDTAIKVHDVMYQYVSWYPELLMDYRHLLIKVFC